MKCQWDETRQELSFETEELAGILCASDPVEPVLCNHRIREFRHQPTGTRLSPEETRGALPRFGFSLFRVLARDAYLTELRATPLACRRAADGLTLTWAPTLRHQVGVEAALTIGQPNWVEMDIRVSGYAYYADYELLISNYLAPGFVSGAYVRRSDSRPEPAEAIRIPEHPAFHGMYNFFPRDERAAHVLTDGRGQRGRWHWRTCCGRCYAWPLTFMSKGNVDVLLMGREEDVNAVGATYAGQEAADGVADHRGQYLSLFGRDLHPGEGWRTQVRLVAGAYGADAQAHRAQLDAFRAAVAARPRTFEVGP